VNGRKIVIKCCETEAMEPEGPGGTPHDEGCRGGISRLDCCGSIRRRGHHRDCRVYRERLAAAGAGEGVMAAAMTAGRGE